MNHRYSSCKPPAGDLSPGGGGGEHQDSTSLLMASMASGDINKMAEAANDSSMLMVVDTDPDHHQHHHNQFNQFNQFKPVENQFNQLKPVEDDDRRGCSPLGATPPDGNVNIDVESHHEGHPHAHHIHNMAGLMNHHNNSMKYGVYSSLSKSPSPSALETIAPTPLPATVGQTAASESIEAVSAASGVN